MITIQWHRLPVDVIRRRINASNAAGMVGNVTTLPITLDQMILTQNIATNKQLWYAACVKCKNDVVVDMSSDPNIKGKLRDGRTLRFRHCIKEEQSRATLTLQKSVVKKSGTSSHGGEIKQSGIPVMWTSGTMLPNPSINTAPVCAKDDAEAEKSPFGFKRDAHLLEEAGWKAVTLIKYSKRFRNLFLPNVASELTIPIVGIGAAAT